MASLKEKTRRTLRRFRASTAGYLRSRAWARRSAVLGASVLTASLVMGYAIWRRHGAPLVGWESPAPALRLIPEKGEFAHDEFVELRLIPGSESARFQVRKGTTPVTASVLKDGLPVPTVGDMDRVRLAFDRRTGHWRGRWPVPWNAPDGEYALALDTAAIPPALLPAETGRFRVVSRAFEPVPEGFSVLTLEGLAPFSRFTGPEGGDPGPEALAEWAEFIGADAVLVQGAESSGHTRKLRASFPWLTRSTAAVAELAQACHRRGIQVGVYVLCYMVGGPPEYSPDYRYGWHYEAGRPVHGLDRPVRRGISIADERRADDIVKVLDHWAGVDGVDFLGLDYIRPVFGSYELVDDFVRDMPGVRTPPGFSEMSPEQRMAWMARGRVLAPRPELRGESPFRTTEQWFWYRAHRTAGVVRRIAEGFDRKKPLWAFTLSWQKGWEHGQDPAMMRDAGVDMNAIMLYEADGEQYRNLVGQWNAYTRDAAFNLVVGNTFDWRLHQKTLDPAGPEAMARRTLDAVEGFQAKRPVRGVFVHDLARGLRGNLGPYPPREWFLAAGSVFTRVRQAHGRAPYRLAWAAPSALGPGETGTATLSLAPGSAGPVEVKFHASGDLQLSTGAVRLTRDASQVAVTLRWVPDGRSAARGDRAFLAVRAHRPDGPRERAQVHATYIQGRRGARSGEAVASAPPPGAAGAGGTGVEP